jgi:hypothetical protein
VTARGGLVQAEFSPESNFFYTRSVPCELWHFDRAKPKERREQVLMIDARNVFRKVTRKIYDFSPEQLQNLASIVWLYRGQRDRFLELVQSYLERTLEEAAAIAPKLEAFGDAEAAVTKAVGRFVRTIRRIRRFGRFPRSEMMRRERWHRTGRFARCLGWARARCHLRLRRSSWGDWVNLLAVVAGWLRMWILSVRSLRALWTRRRRMWMHAIAISGTAVRSGGL